MQQTDPQSERPTLQTALLRGLIGRCPACGKGRLFGAYLKQVDQCSHCGTQFGHMELADAAPWFTMLVVCLLAIPLLFILQPFMAQYLVYTVSFLIVLMTVLILVALPRVKGVLIGAFWFSHSDGTLEGQ